MSWMDTAMRQLTAMTSMAQEASSSLGRLRSTADETHGHVATKLDDLLYKLRQMAEEGDTIASSVLNVVEGVKNGIIPTGAAIHAFGDAMTNIDGRVRSIRDLLSDVLPQMGDVQKQIGETIARMTSYEEGVELLRQTNIGLAATFADLVEAYREGRVTIEEVIRAAEQIKRTMPGSVPDQIADTLTHALQQGHF